MKIRIKNTFWYNRNIGGIYYEKLIFKFSIFVLYKCSLIERHYPDINHNWYVIHIIKNKKQQ